MKTILTMLFCVLLASPAWANPVVLAFGDSTTNRTTPAGVNWPDYLASARPDLAVQNSGLGGDVSPGTRFKTVYDAFGPFAYVVIMIGTNDPIALPGYTPHQTYLNIWAMANYAKAGGSEVYIMTQTPADSRTASNPTLRQSHVLGVSNELAHRDLDNAHSHIHFIYLRDQFTVTPWSALSDDGLHPNATGAVFIGSLVAATLP